MVTLDKWDSHLDCAISDDGLETTCLHKDGFQYMWKGVRATHGVTSGTFMYEVKILENLAVNMPDTTDKSKNICRIGCSLPMSTLFLGDSAEGWGWGGTGKKSNDNEFTEFGDVGFGPGDVIGCIMDVDTLSVSFTRNGKYVGMAFDDIDPAARTVGLFPHILLKNVRVQVNFSKSQMWFPAPSSVYFLNDATSFDTIDNPIEHPTRLQDAEFIMMVGLPACGKTYWALKHMEENPTKGFTLLGTNTVIDQMKVVGLLRKQNYAERWQELISMATPCFNKLCEIAGKTTRNIILDQTNVYPKARERKVQEYMQFGIRRAVVIVNDDNCLQQRTEKREKEEGKFVPVDAVMGMKQNFAKPQLSEGFTHIEYAEAPEQESHKLIKAYNEAGWDYKKRNPGKGSGAKPNTALDRRNVSDLTFDRHGFIGNEDGTASAAKAAPRKKSRSPKRAKGQGKANWSGPSGGGGGGSNQYNHNSSGGGGNFGMQGMNPYGNPYGMQMPMMQMMPQMGQPMMQMMPQMMPQMMMASPQAFAQQPGVPFMGAYQFYGAPM